MPAVALIGPDGAGKTSVTRALLSSPPVPLKYLYMGTAMESSNRMLPTSKLVKTLKEGSGRSRGLVRRIKSGPLRSFWSLGRLINRLAEEWFRQGLSWFYQFRGYLVLYDRHFLIDYSLSHINRQEQDVYKRLHLWFLREFFPRPALVIFLDAPGSVLYARKGEKTPGELEARRQSYLKLQSQFSDWINVDATQDINSVIREVQRELIDFLQRSSHGRIQRARHSGGESC